MQLYAYPVISLWPNPLVGRPFVKLLQVLILLGFHGKCSDCWKIRLKHWVHYSGHPNRTLSDFAEFLQNEIWSVPTQFKKKNEIEYSDYPKGRWNDHRSFLWVVTLLSSRSVRNINHPLCGCAVFVIQKNHLSVIIRLFKPIYNERKGDFNGQ